eukprot:gnl/TRDRNA2_/TRDRNA2_135848_c0_seq1.p1 gnl/TRDRNA2_/TRDRNA2_135848_c0~~gnl/TRDRNA2_/TRDRNA2_135848_c0_seq1.p1  ORF type:complete len:494 (+),score=76.73 gnl/TRDRNA2_/TRDRNA2_135848_c0_seq1:112-1593(+)
MSAPARGWIRLPSGTIAGGRFGPPPSPEKQEGRESRNAAAVSQALRPYSSEAKTRSTATASRTAPAAKLTSTSQSSAEQISECSTQPGSPTADAFVGAGKNLGLTGDDPNKELAALRRSQLHRRPLPGRSLPGGRFLVGLGDGPGPGDYRGTPLLSPEAMHRRALATGNPSAIPPASEPSASAVLSRASSSPATMSLSGCEIKTLEDCGHAETQQTALVRDIIETQDRVRALFSIAARTGCSADLDQGKLQLKDFPGLLREASDTQYSWFGRQTNVAVNNSTGQVLRLFTPRGAGAHRRQLQEWRKDSRPWMHTSKPSTPAGSVALSSDKIPTDSLPVEPEKAEDDTADVPRPATREAASKEAETVRPHSAASQVYRSKSKPETSSRAPDTELLDPGIDLRFIRIGATAGLGEPGSNDASKLNARRSLATGGEAKATSRTSGPAKQKQQRTLDAEGMRRRHSKDPKKSSSRRSKSKPPPPDIQCRGQSLGAGK